MSDGRGKKKNLECYGVSYESIANFVKAHDLEYSSVAYLLRKGISCEDILSGGHGRNKRIKKGVEVEYRGETYRSIKYFAEKNNLVYSDVVKKLSSGNTIEDILESTEVGEKLNKAWRSVEYEGVKYDCFAYFCEELNLKYSTSISRLDKGWTIDELVQGKKSVNGVFRIRDLFPVECDGVVYKDLRDLSLRLGVSERTLRWRLINGWSIQDVVNGRRASKIICKSGLRIEYDGRWFISFMDFAREYGLSYRMALLKYHEGVSLDEIVGVAM